MDADDDQRVSQSGGNLTDDDFMQLGAQQAALIHIQEEIQHQQTQRHIVESEQRQLMGAQQQALVLEQQDAERQMIGQQQLQMLKAMDYHEGDKPVMMMQPPAQPPSGSQPVLGSTQVQLGPPPSGQPTIGPPPFGPPGQQQLGPPPNSQPPLGMPPVGQPPPSGPPPLLGLPPLGPPGTQPPLGPPSGGPLSLGPPGTQPPLGPPGSQLPLGPPPVGQPPPIGPPPLGPLPGNQQPLGPPPTSSSQLGPPLGGPPPPGPPSSGPPQLGPPPLGPPPSGQPPLGPPPVSGQPPLGPPPVSQTSLTPGQQILGMSVHSQMPPGVLRQGAPDTQQAPPPPPPPPPQSQMMMIPDQDLSQPPPSQQPDITPPGEADSESNQQQPPAQQDTDAGQNKEMRLPHALEKVLAFKDVRAQQVGVTPEDVEKVVQGEMPEEEMVEEEWQFSREASSATTEQEPDEEEEEEEVPAKPAKKESKNKKRKKKKKRAKARRSEQETISTLVRPASPESADDVLIEYVADKLDLNASDPAYAEFARIFDTFKIAEPGADEGTDKADGEKSADQTKQDENTAKIPKDAMKDSSDEDEEMAPEEDKPKLSKKKMKKLNRLSVAELKQLVTRPDVVEMHDVTAQDPKLLVHLKATRNTVPVPRHWCFKRKYLQGKRGIEKPPFELPDYIKATGIMEMREALQEKEEQKTMKSKMRERVRPKLGKIDIDYQKLHDAFFKWQTKPKMTIHGDLYYEGKEFETRLKEKKPGNLSEDLRTALGMPIGAGCEKYPPPWLIAMQRYGPPPSYPNLKIPGLNAAIPPDCSFGYHAGGWGKPPVDETGKPLYGDVFGTQTAELQVPVQEEDIDKTQWGALESESEEESEEEESEEEETEADATGLVTPGETGLVTPSGLTSVPLGVETPDMIELRKRRIEDAMDQGGDTPALYTVLPEKKTAVGAAMMGSAHVYDLSAVGKKTDKVEGDGVEVALNPEELDLDTAAMQAKYDQTMREQQSHLEKEDLSDMVAEHAAKQKKRKKQQQDTSKTAKRYKEFKF